MSRAICLHLVVQLLIAATALFGCQRKQRTVLRDPVPDAALQLDLSSLAKYSVEAHFPPSQNTVFCMVEIPDRQRLVIGTANGIAVCELDGTVKRRLLTIEPDSQPNSNTSDRWSSRERLHRVIVALTLLKDGTVCARGLSGAVRLTAEGDVLGDYVTDGDAIQHLYESVLDHPVLQEWFPAAGRAVFLPWAGRRFALFRDGQSEIRGDIPADGDNYWHMRRVHVLGGKPCLAGRGGLMDAETNSWLIKSEHLTELAPVSGDVHLAKDLTHVWVIKGKGRPQPIGEFPGEDIRICALGSKSALLSVYDSSAIGVIEDIDKQVPTMRTVQLPGNHRCRSLLLKGNHDARSGDVPRVLILTSNGIVETDLKNVRIVFEIPRPQLTGDWSNVTAYGIHVFCAVLREDRWLVGTGIGLGRYSPATGTFDWIWRVK